MAHATNHRVCYPCRQNGLEQGDKNGEAVIMLHSYTDSSNTYALVLPLLSPAYHILALDQHGHGNSSKAECCYTMNQMAADVVALMNAKGIGKATLVGRSMGSMIAQLVATYYPNRVARLVLIGSMVAGGNPSVLEMNEAVQTLVDLVDPGFVRDVHMTVMMVG